MPTTTFSVPIWIYNTENDRYWHLHGPYHDFRWKTAKSLRHELEARHYNVGKLSDKSKLIQHVTRARRGLMSYVGLDARQLRTFVDQRGLAEQIASSSGPGARGNLMAVLTEADTALSFHRFLDLPPELRTMVYEYHIADFHAMPYIPKQPPITLVSTLVRKESLPLFYSRCTFDVDLRSCRDFSGHTSLELEAIPRFDSLPRLFDVYLANITTLKITLWSDLWSESSWKRTLKTTVRFSKCGEAFTIEPHGTGDYASSKLVIDGWVRNAASRPAGWKLTRADLEELRIMLKDDLNGVVKK